MVYCPIFLMDLMRDRSAYIVEPLWMRVSEMECCRHIWHVEPDVGTR